MTYMMYFPTSLGMSISSASAISGKPDGYHIYRASSFHAAQTAELWLGSEAAGSGKDGSGLGLYLASRFMEKMGGGLDLKNREGGGFTAEIVIKKV